MQQYTLAEIAEKNGKYEPTVWIVIKDNVYDATKFLREHPGGGELILEVAGGDATKSFNDAGHTADAFMLLKKLKIGQVIEAERKYKKPESRSCLSIITCGLIA